MISVGVCLEEDEDERKLLWVLEEYEKFNEKAFVYWERLDLSVRYGASVEAQSRSSAQEMGFAYDIVIVMVRNVQEIEQVKKIRRSDDKVDIVVILSGDILPEQLILPEIRPILCLRSPLQMDCLSEKLLALFQYVIVRKERSGILRRFSCQGESVRRMIPYSEIYYFETYDKKIVVRTRGGTYRFYDSLVRVETELPPYFIRCHRGYIVNVFYITGMQNKDVLYIGEDTVPIAKKYRRKVQEIFAPQSRVFPAL